MDTTMSVERVIKRCLEVGINCVNIADHDAVEGGLKMQKLAPFPVIVSEEILTNTGEVMGMFLTERIPSGCTAEEAIRQIREQGGLVLVAANSRYYPGNLLLQMTGPGLKLQ